MITGLPAYREPRDQTLRCICSKLYLVSFTGALDSSARADLLGAQFIDARETPFMDCECGVFLDFTEEAAAMVM